MRTHLALLLILLCANTVPAQTARQEKAIELPTGVSVEAAYFSRAGSSVAGICSDRDVRVWGTRSGELLRTLAERDQPPRAVAFSNDGRLLAVAFQVVAYKKGAIRVFDTDSWKVRNEFEAPIEPFAMYTLAFSPDDRRLAFSDLDTRIWDLVRSSTVAKVAPPFGGSLWLSFSEDGKSLATGDGDGFIRVYDASIGNLRSTVDGPLLESLAGAFSPNGRSVVLGAVDKTISIADAKSGKIVRTFPKQPGLILALDVSTDGREVAVVYGSAKQFFQVDHLALWDLDRATTGADFQKPGITIVGGRFVGNEYRFATASANHLAIWSLH